MHTPDATQTSHTPATPPFTTRLQPVTAGPETWRPNPLHPSEIEELIYDGSRFQWQLEQYDRQQSIFIEDPDELVFFLKLAITGNPSQITDYITGRCYQRDGLVPNLGIQRSTDYGPNNQQTTKITLRFGNQEICSFFPEVAGVWMQQKDLTGQLATEIEVYSDLLANLVFTLDHHAPEYYMPTELLD